MNFDKKSKIFGGAGRRLAAPGGVWRRGEAWGRRREAWGGAGMKTLKITPLLGS